MPEFVCHCCQAEIEPDLIEKTGRAECPFCGADVSDIGWPAPTPAAADSPSSGPSRLDDLSAGGELIRPIPAVPDKSRIKVVESTPDRLVLFVSGGGKQAGGLGCFAIAWNGFMCFFTVGMVGGILSNKAGDAPPLVFLIPFMALFWGIGLGFAYFWLKFKYERTFILLDRERIVIQKILFNRKRLNEEPLGPESRAELVESYQQNDTPVYRIEVQGASGAAKFGTALSDSEKDWLVDRINEFLGVAETNDDGKADDDEDLSVSPATTRVYPNGCEKCGAPLTGKPVSGVLACEHCGAVHRGRLVEAPAQERSPTPNNKYERLTAESLPADSAIRIVESSPERLVFRTALAADSPLRWIVPLFAIPFAAAWYGFIGFFAWNLIRGPFDFFGLLPLLFLIPFVAAGLMPLGIGLYAIAGSTTVTVSRERISCRWGAGPLGYTRQVPTEKIDSVKIENFNKQHGNRRVRGNRVRAGSSGAGFADSRSCVIRAKGKMLPLTILEDADCARQVASLVRTKLEELGRPLADV